MSEKSSYFESSHTSVLTADRPAVLPLTSRQRLILWLYAQGLKPKEITEGLYITHYTLQSHHSHINDRLLATSLSEALYTALEHNFLYWQHFVTEESAKKLQSLRRPQKRVLNAFLQTHGGTNIMISESTGYTPQTVQAHMATLAKEFQSGTRVRTLAVAYAAHHSGLLP